MEGGACGPLFMIVEQVLRSSSFDCNEDCDAKPPKHHRTKESMDVKVYL